MNSIGFIIAICAFALVIGGVILIKQSAKKFNLSDEQLKKVKQRQQEQLEKDKVDGN